MESGSARQPSLKGRERAIVNLTKGRERAIVNLTKGRERAIVNLTKGRERAIVNQRNTETISKATLGKLLRDGVERIIMRFSERSDTILNWTKLECSTLKDAIKWMKFGCVGPALPLGR